MKKMMSVVLGMSLVLGSAVAGFASDAKKAEKKDHKQEHKDDHKDERKDHKKKDH